MTVDPLVLGGFLVAVALVELTPGPNMGYLAVVAASKGRRAGFAAVAGVTAGLAVYLVLSAVGLTEALLRAPGLFQALRWAGVAFLLWLAWGAWRGEAETSPGRAHATEGLGGLVWRGFLSNVLNPKAAVFYIVLLPGFLRPERGGVLGQTLALGAIHLAVSVAVHGAVVLGAARAGTLLGAAASGSLTRRGFAVAIAATALWLAWQTR